MFSCVRLTSFESNVRARHLYCFKMQETCEIILLYWSSLFRSIRSISTVNRKDFWTFCTFLSFFLPYLKQNKQICNQRLLGVSWLFIFRLLPNMENATLREFSKIFRRWRLVHAGRFKKMAEEYRRLSRQQEVGLKADLRQGKSNISSYKNPKRMREQHIVTKLAHSPRRPAKSGEKSDENGKSKGCCSKDTKVFLHENKLFSIINRHTIYFVVLTFFCRT